jgi:hypothetical protein
VNAAESLGVSTTAAKPLGPEDVALMEKLLAHDQS